MKNIMGLIFLIPFSFVAFAAESPEQSPFVKRGVDLGNTGTARPQRANSLQRAPTIRVNLPRKTSAGDEKKTFHKSPRNTDDFAQCKAQCNVKPVVLPQAFDFSQPPVEKTIPSYGVAEKK